MESLKYKIIFLITALGLVLFLIFNNGLYSKEEPRGVIDTQTAEIMVINVTPNLSEDDTILPTQTIEITFNHPLENAPEVRHKIEPKVEYKVELSDDRKTAKFIPVTAFELGQGYSLEIGPETKFDGKKTLNKNLNYNFKIINYRGI